MSGPVDLQKFLIPQNSCSPAPINANVGYLTEQFQRTMRQHFSIRLFNIIEGLNESKSYKLVLSGVNGAEMYISPILQNILYEKGLYKPSFIFEISVVNGSIEGAVSDLIDKIRKEYINNKFYRSELVSHLYNFGLESKYNLQKLEKKLEDGSAFEKVDNSIQIRIPQKEGEELIGFIALDDASMEGYLSVRKGSNLFVQNWVDFYNSLLAYGSKRTFVRLLGEKEFERIDTQLTAIGLSPFYNFYTNDDTGARTNNKEYDQKYMILAYCFATMNNQYFQDGNEPGNMSIPLFKFFQFFTTIPFAAGYPLRPLLPSNAQGFSLKNSTGNWYPSLDMMFQYNLLSWYTLNDSYDDKLSKSFSKKEISQYNNDEAFMKEYYSKEAISTLKTIASDGISYQSHVNTWIKSDNKTRIDFHSVVYTTLAATWYSRKQFWVSRFKVKDFIRRTFEFSYHTSKPSPSSNGVTVQRFGFPMNVLLKNSTGRTIMGLADSLPVNTVVYTAAYLSTTLKKSGKFDLDSYKNVQETGQTFYEFELEGKDGFLFFTYDDHDTLAHEAEIFIPVWTKFYIKSKQWKYIANVNTSEGDNILNYRLALVVRLVQMPESRAEYLDDIEGTSACGTAVAVSGAKSSVVSHAIPAAASADSYGGPAAAGSGAPSYAIPAVVHTGPLSSPAVYFSPSAAKSSAIPKAADAESKVVDTLIELMQEAENKQREAFALRFHGLKQFHVYDVPEYKTILRLSELVTETYALLKQVTQLAEGQSDNVYDAFNKRYGIRLNEIQLHVADNIYSVKGTVDEYKIHRERYLINKARSEEIYKTYAALTEEDRKIQERPLKFSTIYPDLGELRDKLGAKKIDIEIFKKQIQEEENRIKSLQSQKEQSEQTIRTLTYNVIPQLKANISWYELSLGKTPEERAFAKFEIKKISKLLNAANNTIKEQPAELAKIEGKIEVAQGEIKTFEGSLQEAQKSVEDLEPKLKEKEQEVAIRHFNGWGETWEAMNEAFLRVRDSLHRGDIADFIYMRNLYEQYSKAKKAAAASAAKAKAHEEEQARFKKRVKEEEEKREKAAAKAEEERVKAAERAAVEAKAAAERAAVEAKAAAERAAEAKIRLEIEIDLSKENLIGTENAIDKWIQTNFHYDESKKDPYTSVAIHELYSVYEPFQFPTFDGYAVTFITCPQSPSSLVFALLMCLSRRFRYHPQKLDVAKAFRIHQLQKIYSDAKDINTPLDISHIEQFFIQNKLNLILHIEEGVKGNTYLKTSFNYEKFPGRPGIVIHRYAMDEYYSCMYYGKCLLEEKYLEEIKKNHVDIEVKRRETESESSCTIM
jgi:hypothetical protein